MFINEIDDIFDNSLNIFYNYLVKEKFFIKIKTETNFVKFQNMIIETIKKFISNKYFVKLKQKWKDNYDEIIDIIKRYCAFYIYLGIAFFYIGDRDLFITNILETTRDQKNSSFIIKNFFNSENNSKIIKYFSDIKNILELIKFKTYDRIKIMLKNNPIKYDTTIKIFNELGEDYVIKNFMIKNNFHNIIKTFIFRFIYLSEEKKDIINLLNYIEKKNSVYKFIDIVISSKNKLADFSVFQQFTDILSINNRYANDFYDYLNNYVNKKIININTLDKDISVLFNKEIIIPITEDVLRFHKNKLKYDNSNYSRDNTKIKILINQVNKVKNLYSDIFKKNPKLKLEVLDMFYKPLFKRDIILFNDDEELKIIKKLEESDLSTDIDLLVDLESIRKYCLMNFNNLSKDGFKLRTDKTIKAIRYSSIKNSTNDEDKIETRIGNNIIDMNVIGIAFNPLNIPLDCIKVKNIKNVRITKNDNGFNLFIKKIEESFYKKERVLYYWMFDTKTDNVKLEEYRNVSSLDIEKNIKIMLSVILDKYRKLSINKILKEINLNEDFSVWKLNNILIKYSDKLNLINNTNDKNTLIYESLKKNLKEIDVIEDKYDSYIPGKFDDLIILPLMDTIKKENKTLIIKDDKEDDNNILEDETICYHYLKWREIMRIPSKYNDLQSQEIFNFAKKYVKTDERNNYLCKSCNEFLNIKKFVVEGTYIPELDQFLTTNLIVSQDLYDIQKYSKYTRTIRNIEKNIEKISYYLDLNYYIGNNSTIKLHRRVVIKDVIDLILIHTEYLKEQPKNRIELYSKKYNINKDLTTLFFFSLKDEIFLTDSTETDYYKIIKFNNVILYIMLNLITEFNSGQLLNLKNSKSCNFFIFSKVSDTLFKDLYLRINSQEMILITKIPLLCYVIYYFSCVITNNFIWLWNIEKNKNYLVQNVIIHSIIDLMNSIFEANLNKDKNFLYEKICAKLNNKIKTIYNDKKLYERIEEEGMKNIRIDSKTKKIKMVRKRIEFINIIDNNIPLELKQNYSIFCDTELYKINKLKYDKFNNEISLITNCEDGKFHKWDFNSSNLVCSLCNKKYNDIIKKQKTLSIKNNKKIIDKILISYLKNLTKNYCITGELHEINSNGICNKCKINPEKFKYNSSLLMELKKNLNKKENEKILLQINKFRKINNKFLKKEKINSEKIKDFNDNFNKIHSFNNYLDDFIDLIKKLVGNKITYNGKDIFIDETKYIIDHNYIGNLIKKPIIFSSKDEKIEFEENNSIFNKDVYFYKDNKKKIIVYYDAVTKNHLGYTNYKKKVFKIRNNLSIKINYSIKDMIKNLGLQNEYVNIIDLDYNLEIYNDNKVNKIKNKLLEKNIRNRSYNLIYIINKTKNIIETILNNKSKSSKYMTDDNDLINNFNKILKNIITEENDIIFMENSDLILN